MNPPYEKSLHLKVLEQIIPNCEKVINISPCRWLEDPLAQYKKNSDYCKFEESVAKKIEDIDIINSSESNNAFNIEHSDLAIYVLGKGGYNYKKLSQMDSITSKIFNKCNGNKTIMDISTVEGYRGKHDGIFGMITSHRNDYDKFISEKYDMFTTYRETHGNKLIFFKTETECKNCFTYLTSKLMRYYSLQIKKNQRNPWQFVPVIDFSKSCDKKYLTEFFGLTESEWKKIEGV